VRKLLNRALRHLGARIERTDAPAEWQYVELRKLYDRNVVELYDCLRHEVFPDLPLVEGREDLLKQLVGTNIGEATWLIDRLHKALRLDGDVCEFGIAEGATSALMANEIRGTTKKLWLFDSFEGLSRPGPKDELIDDMFRLGSMARYQGRMKYSPDEVLTRIQNIAFPRDRLELVPGFIEDTVKAEHLPTGICFAYVDFDLYDPILVALEFISGRMPLAGTIIVDDYGFFSAGAQAAVDEFAQAHSNSFEITVPPSRYGNFAVLQRVGVDQDQAGGCRGAVLD